MNFYPFWCFRDNGGRKPDGKFLYYREENNFNSLTSFRFMKTFSENSGIFTYPNAYAKRESGFSIIGSEEIHASWGVVLTWLKILFEIVCIIVMY